jgi:site-specific recombinase XerD
MPKMEHKLLTAVALADVRKLLDACEDSYDPLRDAAIIRLLADTGLRASELCALTVGDVTGRRIAVQHGKGDKARAVFIGDVTRRALAEYLSTRPGVGPGDALFVSLETGGALSYDSLKQVLGRLGHRAGVTVHAHALRRTFAVESLRAGCDLVTLARLMGHKDLVMLQNHYLPLLEADIEAAHDRTSPGDRLGA